MLVGHMPPMVTNVINVTKMAVGHTSQMVTVGKIVSHKPSHHSPTDMLDKNRERKRFPVVSWAFPFRVISVRGEHIHVGATYI